MRFVFDTNVVVSALLLPSSLPRKAFDLGTQKGKILLSFGVLAEQWVEPNTRITACRDAEDNKFLELAVSGDASHIVTGDSDLLALNPFRGVQIISPAAFLKL